MDLKGTRILVTGGTSGIGRAIAASLTQHGAAVRAIGKDVCDLSESTAVEQLATTLASEGSLDWIIHSAGYIDMREPEGGEPSTIKHTFAVNTYAPIILQRSLETSLTNTGGAIFIASTAGLGGNGQYPIYAASKAALIAYAKSLAFSWEHSARRSITIAPGPTNTPMREGFGDAASQQSPSVIAELVVQICTGTGKNGDLFVVRDGSVSLSA